MRANHHCQFLLNIDDYVKVHRKPSFILFHRRVLTSFIFEKAFSVVAIETERATINLNNLSAIAKNGTFARFNSSFHQISK